MFEEAPLPHTEFGCPIFFFGAGRPPDEHVYPADLRQSVCGMQFGRSQMWFPDAYFQVQWPRWRWVRSSCSWNIWRLVGAQRGPKALGNRIEVMKLALLQAICGMVWAPHAPPNAQACNTYMHMMIRLWLSPFGGFWLLQKIKTFCDPMKNNFMDGFKFLNEALSNARPTFSPKGNSPEFCWGGGIFWRPHGDATYAFIKGKKFDYPLVPHGLWNRVCSHRTSDYELGKLLLKLFFIHGQPPAHARIALNVFLQFFLKPERYNDAAAFQGAFGIRTAIITPPLFVRRGKEMLNPNAFLNYYNSI